MSSACALRVTSEYSYTNLERKDSWVNCWLVVNGSDDGIRTHASRPRMIRNAVPYPLGHITTFMLSLINQLVHPSIHWFIYSCIHSLIHTLFHALMHFSITKFTYIFINSCIYWCCPTFINGSCCQYYQLLPTLISFPLASNLKLKYPFLKLCDLKANFW